MREVKLEGAADAQQLVAGVRPNEESGIVVVALEDAAGGWLVYAAEPAMAREIAQTILVGADIAEGLREVAPDEFETNADDFERAHREHRG